MFYLQLEAPSVTEKEGKVRISVDTVISAEDRKEMTLWYEVSGIDKNDLYVDRIDPFLIAILPYCMEKGYDIQVSEKAGVSVDLLYQLTKILIPSLKGYYDFHMININAKPVYEALKQGTGAAAGVSRGVDSFYTILNNLDGFFPLSYLTLFNVQSFGQYGGDAAREYFRKEVEKAEKICEDLNREYGTHLSLITIDSNIQDKLPIRIYSSGPYRDAGPMLLLKQLLRVYYVAADVNLENFEIGGIARRYNPWIFYCLSTEGFRIQLFGTEASRLDKVEYISEFPVTYDNLRVCLQPLIKGEKGILYESQNNCTCNCSKCRYTVMELLAVDGLEHYDKVFDLKLVQEKYQELLADVVLSRKDSPHNKGVYQALYEKGIITDQIIQEIEGRGSLNEIPNNHDALILGLLDRFLEKVQNGISLEKQLKNRGFHTVAIYGMGRLGKILYRELKNIVSYEIDKNRNTVYGENVVLMTPEEELPKVDLVIITTVYGKEEIRRHLARKMGCEIMTLGEVLNFI